MVRVQHGRDLFLCLISRIGCNPLLIQNGVGELEGKTLGSGKERKKDVNIGVCSVSNCPSFPLRLSLAQRTLDLSKYTVYSV